jgi:hypothetical protein
MVLDNDLGPQQEGVNLDEWPVERFEDALEREDFLAELMSKDPPAEIADVEAYGRENDNDDDASEVWTDNFVTRTPEGRFETIFAPKEADSLDESYRRLSDICRKQILLDLGAGSTGDLVGRNSDPYNDRYEYTSRFRMQMVAASLGVHSLVQIDKNYPGRSDAYGGYKQEILGDYMELYPHFLYEQYRYDSTFNTMSTEGKKVAPCLHLKTDMLEVLRRIPDSSSVNIAINGIDDLVIDEPDYHEELAKQIDRVLKPGNCVFGNNSEVIKILKTSYAGYDYEEISYGVLVKRG